MTFRHGDCLAADGLPSLSDRSVGVTISDPPFDGRTHRAARDAKDWRDGARTISGALPFAPLEGERLVEAAHQLARVTARWIILFAAERQLEPWAQALELSGARVVRFGTVLKSNPRPQMSGDRPGVGVDYLVIAHAKVEGRMRWRGGGKPATWTTAGARFDTRRLQLHPCQKSEALMRALITDFVEPGELVCDPFAGVATTLVAAAQLGMPALGWELDADYHRIGSRRINEATAQARLAL